jgi:UDP-N-acetylglucosamine--N-acetylmuramyl-(pentapeptide) pyrophosphoryl-undecaprenol N-acetylglucosamine transferase
MQPAPIVFTGGGSGGHVMPALTLIDELQRRGGFDIAYVGSHTGIEREVVTRRGLPYTPIATGKLRRYLSVENLTDIGRVAWGTLQAFAWFLRRPRGLVFSTGGFVSVPVVVAGRLTGQTVFVHEQTSRAGLANRLAAKFAHAVFVSFEASVPLFPAGKTEMTGYPLRAACFAPLEGPVTVAGRDLGEVDAPVLFVTGGGNGSKLLNEWIRDHLDALQEHFFVVHQVGKAFAEEYVALDGDRYVSTAFVDDMIGVLRTADVVVSRAGAGTVQELMALGKRSLFVPLAIAQKNEQYHNAMEAHERLGSVVVTEDQLAATDLVDVARQLASDAQREPAVEGDATRRLADRIATAVAR